MEISPNFEFEIKNIVKINFKNIFEHLYLISKEFDKIVYNLEGLASEDNLNDAQQFLYSIPFENYSQGVEFVINTAEELNSILIQVQESLKPIELDEINVKVIAHIQTVKSLEKITDTGIVFVQQLTESLKHLYTELDNLMNLTSELLPFYEALQNVVKLSLENVNVAQQAKNFNFDMLIFEEQRKCQQLFQCHWSQELSLIEEKCKRMIEKMEGFMLTSNKMALELNQQMKDTVMAEKRLVNLEEKLQIQSE